MPRNEEGRETSEQRTGMGRESEAGAGKEIFMRARAGNINISFPTEEEASLWEDRLVSKLKKEGGFRVRAE
ncbi:MAG: hypothetical protein FIB08_02150 [Candidatus Methanoperedens sp.]|nr:hypothetical protein [Candidatus Methanoperedens sp.]